MSFREVNSNSLTIHLFKHCNPQQKRRAFSPGTKEALAFQRQARI